MKEHLRRLQTRSVIFERGYCDNCGDVRIFNFLQTRYNHGERYDFYECKRCGDIKEGRKIKVI